MRARVPSARDFRELRDLSRERETRGREARGRDFRSRARFIFDASKIERYFSISSEREKEALFRQSTQRAVQMSRISRITSGRNSHKNEQFPRERDFHREVELSNL